VPALSESVHSLPELMVQNCINLANLDHFLLHIFLCTIPTHGSKRNKMSAFNLTISLVAIYCDVVGGRGGIVL